MALRQVPRPGDEVTIRYLGVELEGEVLRVSSDLHALEVLTEEGDVLPFRLSSATATFVAAAGHSRARLSFRAPPAYGCEPRPRSNQSERSFQS